MMHFRGADAPSVAGVVDMISGWFGGSDSSDSDF